MPDQFRENRKLKMAINMSLVQKFAQGIKSSVFSKVDVKRDVNHVILNIASLNFFKIL